MVDSFGVELGQTNIRQQVDVCNRFATVLPSMSKYTEFDIWHNVRGCAEEVAAKSDGNGDQ
ncbi:hypothetical protein T265_16317, partial [Opisthorchis viverrini]